MESILKQTVIKQDFIEQAWNKTGFKELTAIQRKAIPLMMEGHDLIIESPTGTGKTLAYLLPLLEKADAAIKSPQALILAPTRELVMQIHQEAVKFTEGSGISCASFIGGADIKRQLEKLKKHPQIVVGTPGRINELINMKKLKMHEVKTIVLDEADQIIELKLLGTVEEITRATQKDRQLILCSATISEMVEKKGKEIMNEPQVVRVNTDELPKANVEHLYIVCERRDKIDTLRRLVRMTKGKYLAFINESVHSNEIASKLRFKGIDLGILHGEAKKTERETILNHFRSDKLPLLLATDVAARGLDIQGLTHVIHFDFPQDVDQYVHRSGRTGRMGANGTVISIITPNEEGLIRKFAKELDIPIQRRALYMGKLVEQQPREKVAVVGKKTKRP